MIDTHAHLNDVLFKKNFDYIIKNSIKENINKIFDVGTDYLTIKKSIFLSKKYKNIKSIIGWHPYNINDFFLNSKKIFENYLYKKKNSNIIAIGEIGLDFHFIDFNKIKQIEIFYKQIKIAKFLKLPIVIHMRESFEEIYNILKKEKIWKIGACIHSFNCCVEKLKKILSLGNNIYISFNGIITFKNSNYLNDVIKYIPLNRILVETDSPYLTPVPFRGKINEPKNIIYIMKKISKIKNISFYELEKNIERNVNKLFFKKII